LLLNITFSGLTIGNDVALGLAGLEHYILTTTATLGALDLKDEFAFATPYINCPYYKPAKYWYIDYFLAIGPFDTCRPVGDLMFVKKRVSLELSLGGLTFSTLIMFEDVNFPTPTATGPIPYTTDMQDFNFGAIVGISGTTVSGIQIEAKTGFCADWTIWAPYLDVPKFTGTTPYGGIFEYITNTIKKYRWYENVCKTGELGMTKEFIGIYNINVIPNVVLNSYTIMMPTPGFTFDSYMEALYTLPMGLGTLQGFFHMVGGLGLGGPEYGTILLTLPGINVLWFDADSDWTLTAADEVVGSIAFDVQNASFLVDALFIPTVGVDRLLVEADLPISYPEPIGTLEITGLWVAPEEGAPIEWYGVDFNMVKNIGEHNNFKIDAQFTTEGLSALEFAIGVTFSL